MKYSLGISDFLEEISSLSMLVYTGNFKAFTKNWKIKRNTKLICEFNKISDAKSMYKNKLHFYTLETNLKMKFKIPFIIA